MEPEILQTTTTTTNYNNKLNNFFKNKTKIEKEKRKFDLLLLPLIAVVVLDTDDDATANVVIVFEDAVNEALVVADEVLTFVGGDCGDSEFGDEGGEVFISSNNGDLLVVALIFGAPFNAELLASCK